MTLPEYSYSVLDTDLIDTIITLDYPLAMVTGRSDGWLRRQFRQTDRLHYLNLPIYIEFGLAYFHQGQLHFQRVGEDFLKIRSHLIELLREQCEKENVYFEPDQWYDDFPSHGSLWVEDKHIQLSIAANDDVPTPRVHQLCDEAWSDISDNVRILHHHLGIDVIPQDWSKAKATSHFISNLDQSQYHWYVFGDNSSDREMVQGLDQVDFISTSKSASQKVRSTLSQLGIAI